MGSRDLSGDGRAVCEPGGFIRSMASDIRLRGCLPYPAVETVGKQARARIFRFHGALYRAGISVRLCAGAGVGAEVVGLQR